MSHSLRQNSELQDLDYGIQQEIVRKLMAPSGLRPRPHEVLACRDWWQMWQGQVKTVHLSQKKESSVEPSALLQLRKYPELKGMKVTLRGLKTYSFMQPLLSDDWMRQRLQELQIHCTCGMVDVETMEALHQFRELVALDMKVTVFDDATAIDMLADFTHLRCLVLDILCLHGTWPSVMDAVGKLEQLQQLTVKNMALEDVCAGARWVAPLQNLTALESLTIEYAKLILPLPPGLKHLDMHVCSVGELNEDEMDGMDEVYRPQLVNSSSNSILETLTVKHMDSDAQLAYIPFSPHLRSFHWTQRRCGAISKAAVRSLLDKHAGTLETVDLGMQTFPVPVDEMLPASLPACKHLLVTTSQAPFYPRAEMQEQTWLELQKRKMALVERGACPSMLASDAELGAMLLPRVPQLPRMPVIEEMLICCNLFHNIDFIEYRNELQLAFSDNTAPIAEADRMEPGAALEMAKMMRMVGAERRVGSVVALGLSDSSCCSNSRSVREPSRFWWRLD